MPCFEPDRRGSRRWWMARMGGLTLEDLTSNLPYKIISTTISTAPASTISKFPSTSATTATAAIPDPSQCPASIGTTPASCRATNSHFATSPSSSQPGKCPIYPNPTGTYAKHEPISQPTPRCATWPPPSTCFWKSTCYHSPTTIGKLIR